MPELLPSPGTVTLTNGETAFTGTGTALRAGRTGDMIVLADGRIAVLASDPTDDAAGTLTKAWGDTTATDVAYTLVSRSDGAQVAAVARLLISTTQSTSALATASFWARVAGTDMADPGTAGIVFNNATIASVTAIALSDVDGAVGDIGATIDGLTSGSRIVIQSTTRPSKRAIFLLVSEADNSGWHQLNVTFESGASVLDWQTDEDLMIIFSPAGPKGDSAGAQLQFSTTTAKSDPGAGAFRANNATFGSITELYIDNTDLSANSLTDLLDTLDSIVNAVGSAVITFQKVTDAASFMQFLVTGTVVDETGYRTVPVSPVAGAIPDDETLMSLAWALAGQDGEAWSAWQGQWETATAYALDDVVANDGSSWVCIQAHTSGDLDDEPGVGAVTATYWDLLAEKGDTGDQGIPGSTGNPGLVWQGAWDSGTSYSQNDLVTDDNASAETVTWIALQGNSNSKPKDNPSDWGLFPATASIPQDWGLTTDAVTTTRDYGLAE